MKHLRKFNESSVDTTKQDITEICYDLTDGRFDVKVYDDFPGWGRISGMGVIDISNSAFHLTKEDKIVIISLSDYRDYNGFSFNEVREVVLRLIDYLGDRYKGCSALSVGEHLRSNINKKEIDSHYLNMDYISNLVIIYR